MAPQAGDRHNLSLCHQRETPLHTLEEGTGIDGHGEVPLIGSNLTKRLEGAQGGTVHEYIDIGHGQGNSLKERVDLCGKSKIGPLQKTRCPSSFDLPFRFLSCLVILKIIDYYPAHSPIGYGESNRTPNSP
jgi:hypothetical protein